MKHIKLFENFLNEGVHLSTDDTTKIKTAIKNNAFLSLRPVLSKLGFMVDFSFEPHAHFYVTKKGANDSVIIINKKYAENPDFVHGDIAMGLTEKKL